MNIQVCSRKCTKFQVRIACHQNSKALICSRRNSQLRETLNTRQVKVMIDLKICAVIKINLRHGEHGKFLVRGWDSNACIERRQVPTATKSTTYAELLGLTDVERSRSWVSDGKSVVVELVVVDVVVGKARYSHVDTVGH